LKIFCKSARIYFASDTFVFYIEDVATAGRDGGNTRKNGVELAPPALPPGTRSDRLSRLALGTGHWQFARCVSGTGVVQHTRFSSLSCGG